MPSQPHSGGVDVLGLVYLALVLAVIFLPVVLARPAPPPGQSDSDSDGGGGDEPWPPPSPSSGPGGGIPLDDAAPARTRLRGPPQPSTYSRGKLGTASKRARLRPRC
jgi:hypothetical protein